MDYELPTDFDIIIIGTGVVESIISAAASRIGKRVLHIDSNQYYGGLWASFNLDTFLKLDARERAPDSPPTDLINPNEQSFPVGNDYFNLKNLKTQWHIPKDSELEGEVTQESLLKESRKFNIDLAPKLQFARGEFVELLISSNIARYSEYRSVSRVLTWLNDHLETVPCSRSDVFANNKVSVIEKRMLMKLFMALDGGDEDFRNYDTKTFRAYLSDKRLTPNLIHYVLYAISMSTDQTPCPQGIQKTKRFLDSLGRFGKTPFLFSMYGSGEITQAFCRLSAVFGGTYALGQPLKRLIFDEGNNFKGLISGKQRINAEVLVMGAEKAPPEFVEAPPRAYISRAVIVTDRSLMASEKEHLTLLLYPPDSGKENSCVVLELGALTGTCPKDFYLVHLISKQVASPEEDFKHCIANLFSQCKDDTRPNILWSCYFSIPDSNDQDLKSDYQNVVLCPGPDLNLDYDGAVGKARAMFSKLYPEAEFLPRAPDPEDIIIEDDAAEEKGAGGDKEEIQIEAKSEPTKEE